VVNGYKADKGEAGKIGWWESAKMGVGEYGNPVIAEPFLDSGSPLRCGRNDEFCCKVNNYRLSKFKYKKH
jgi:hypothetical protein